MMLKRIGRWMSVFLIIGMVLGNVLPVSAITTVDLGEGTNVSQQSAKGDFVVKLKNEGDTMEIYRLAAMNWDVGTSTYTSLAWVNEVLAWVNGSAGFKSYTTPDSLSRANQATQTAFYEAIMEDTTLLESLYKVPPVSMLVEPESAVWGIVEQSLGQYLVCAKQALEAGTYQPLTVNLVPQQSGPTGNWYLPNIEVSIKNANLSIDKTINGKDSELVALGDEVDFAIEFGVPTYDPDGNTNKTFILDDDMSTAFAYKEGTLKVTAWDGENWVEIPSTDYTAVISSDVTVYTCPTTGHDYFNVYQVRKDATTYVYYFLQNGIMNLLYTGGSNSTDVNKAFLAYKALTGDTINHTMQPANIEKNLFNINFDWTKLGSGMTKIKVEYVATVTESIAIGADTNTNTAHLYYEKDLNGTVTHIDDEVIAWTYGLNIKKIDGNISNTYLSGAIFTLYIKAGVFCKTGVEADDAAFTWESSFNGDVENTPNGFANLKDELSYCAANGINTVVVKTDGVEHEGDDAHMEAELYVEIRTEITSVANANGVTIKGLNIGDYMLVEEIAPSGYNKLTEAILFSINKLTEEQAETANGSYKTFVDDEENVQSTGIYSITVENYTGLQLPETGGGGTVIFTICGILLMFGAITLIVLKSRKKPSLAGNAGGAMVSGSVAATMEVSKENKAEEKTEVKGDEW